MTRRNAFSHLGILLLAGWCLLFLRTSSTDQSMVRAVFLAHEDGQICVGLIYQAPEAAADASEALAQLRFASARAETLEGAWNAVEYCLPKKANYRLCDQLLLPEEEFDDLMRQYETLVISRGCGRTAARVSVAEFTMAEFEEWSEETQDLSDKLMEQLKRSARQMPRLYQQGECSLYPVVKKTAGGFALEGGVLSAERTELSFSEEDAALFRLLTGQGGEQTLHLGDAVIRLRRCIVSKTLERGRITLRLDCQTQYGAEEPTTAQKQQLERLCTQMVQSLWAQGIDLLGVEAQSTLQWGREGAVCTTKNACPEIRTDVRFF